MKKNPKLRQTLEGLIERQAEREKKRRGHVVRKTRNTELGERLLPNLSEPVQRDVVYEMAWMNRGSRI